MRNIDLYVPPYEPFCIFNECFTPADCDRIIEHGELAEFSRGAIGGSRKNPEGETNDKVRLSDIVWLQPDDDKKWIFERMNEVATRVNHDKFQVKLAKFDGFQYSKYDVDGHYDWHIDILNQQIYGGPAGWLFRKLTFSVFLNDPADYKGGELLLNLGNQTKPYSVKPKKGDVVILHSYIPHKVKPVTSGVRNNLVTWGLGSKWV